MANLIGIYIHIPFCRSKCAYCDFFSGKGSEIEFDYYTKELKDKIQYWGNIADESVCSVYFGGGTPSVMGADRLCEILSAVKDSFHVLENTEITVEVNPDSGRVLDFAKMYAEGFNRISIGMQSCIEKELQTLGRIHTSEDVKTTIQRAKAAGFSNLSLDLMMGIPHQTKESLKESIDFCAYRDVTHISAYLLKIEENTPFYSKRELLNLPDEDTQADLYLFAVDYLSKLGYEQYEISNFARNNYESRHNTLYWQCGEYIGIGPSAHSFYKGNRFFYERNINSFYDNRITSDGKGGDEDEYVLLALRLKRGLNFEEYRRRFGKSIPERFIKKCRLYANAGYMEFDKQRVCFTPKGFLVSNLILSEII